MGGDTCTDIYILLKISEGTSQFSLGGQSDPRVDKEPGENLKEGRVLRLEGGVEVADRLGALCQEDIDKPVHLHRARDLVVYQVTVVVGEDLQTKMCTNETLS